MHALMSLLKKITPKSVVRCLGRVFIFIGMMKLLTLLGVILFAPYALATGVLMPIGLFAAAWLIILVAAIGIAELSNALIVQLDRITRKLPA
jgi:hypothetical protein